MMPTVTRSSMRAASRTPRMVRQMPQPATAALVGVQLHARPVLTDRLAGLRLRPDADPRQSVRALAKPGGTDLLRLALRPVVSHGFAHGQTRPGGGPLHAPGAPGHSAHGTLLLLALSKIARHLLVGHHAARLAEIGVLL